MEDHAVTEYIDRRFADALYFYDARAISNKRWYRWLSTYIIVVSAGLSPLVAFAPAEPRWRALAASLSASIVAATAVLGHFKFHENWLSFRASWDALQREREYYRASSGGYRWAQDRNALFVERVEAILARESSDFFARHEPRREQPTPKEEPQ